MKASAKKSVSTSVKKLRSEYDLTKLRNGVRGKYLARANAATNLVLIEPDLMPVFADSESVNPALRMLAETARAAAQPRK